MIPAMRVRPFGVAAGLVLLLAATLRFGALDAGLPNPRTRPDEMPVVQQLARVDRGEPITMLIYPNAFVYATWAWTKVGLALAPVFGPDTTGGLQKTLLTRPERIYLIGRAASATAGTLAVLLVLILAGRAFGRETALAAAALVATCFLHARDSHALKPDALLSLAVLASLGASAALAARVSPARVAGAGVAFGLAMATKYTGLLMAVPLWVAGCLSSPANGFRRAAPISAVAAGVIGAVVFALTSPQLVFEGPLLDLARSVGSIVLPDLISADAGGSLVGGGSEVPAIYAAPPGVELADYRDRAWYHGLVFHTTFSMWYGMGAIATLLAPFALVWGFRQRQPLALLAAVTCAVQLVVMGLTPAVTARYLTQVLPVLLLLEAGLIADLARRFVPSRSGLVLFAATGVIAAQPLYAIVAHNQIASQTDTRVLAARWLEDNAPSGTRIAFAGSVLMPYGQPTPPPTVQVVAHGLDPAVLDSAGAQLLVAHDHSLYFSSLDPEAMRALAPRLRRLALFDPREGADLSLSPVFEETDAYYIPVHGFGGVSRPGPRVEIFALEPGPQERE